jgi:anti-sigma factor RsiW
MTGLTSCRQIRQALGVYVLGAIEPAERAEVDEHLATCPECREELASLAGLPAMLRKVPVAEAERLASADYEPDPGEVPSEAMLRSLVGRTAQVRRIHRWRGLAAAAAVAIVALGGGAAVTRALEPAAPAPAIHGWHMAGGTSAAGVHLTVKYRQAPWGTAMEVHVTGLKPGSVCQFLVTDRSGTSWPAGGWVLRSWQGSTWFPASTWFSDADLHAFQLSVGGKVVVSARAT